MTDHQTIGALLPRAEILAQLAEECAELAQAALKLRRALTGDNPTPVSEEDAEDHLWEEIGDVILCVNLLVEWPVNKDAASAIDKLMDKKEARWARRLRAAKNGKGAGGMKQEEIMEVIERVTQYVVMNQVEATISIQPDMISIELQPWRPFEMNCPYGKVKTA